jgi:hypothetical protein
MKDIKIKKVEEKIKPNKILEKSIVVTDNAKISRFSSTLFGFMALSIFTYVFFVSSSIFYAVQEREFVFKQENIATESLAQNSEQEEFKLLTKNNSSKVSFLNKDSDDTITLK